MPIDEAMDMPEPQRYLEAAFVARRLARLVADTLGNLPSWQRIALLKRKYEVWSYGDIAETWDVRKKGFLPICLSGDAQDKAGHSHNSSQRPDRMQGG